MHGWVRGYETAPLQCRKRTKTTWNSPTVGLVMDCVQMLVNFLLFAVRDFRRGWVLSGACWIFGVLMWMLNSSINARNPWLHLQKTTGDLETLVLMFRTWKYLLSPRISFLLLPAAYHRLLSINCVFSTGSFPHRKALLLPCCSCGSEPFISGLSYSLSFFSLFFVHQLCSFSYRLFSLPSSLPWAICHRIQQTIVSPPSIIFLG